MTPTRSAGAASCSAARWSERWWHCRARRWPPAAAAARRSAARPPAAAAGGRAGGGDRRLLAQLPRAGPARRRRRHDLHGRLARARGPDGSQPGHARGRAGASPPPTRRRSRENVWHVRLRDGATFHDGTPVRASDVVFSFDRIRDPKTASFFISYLDFIKKRESGRRHDRRVRPRDSRSRCSRSRPIFIRVVPQAIVSRRRESDVDQTGRHRPLQLRRAGSPTTTSRLKKLAACQRAEEGRLRDDHAARDGGHQRSPRRPARERDRRDGGPGRPRPAVARPSSPASERPPSRASTRRS